MNKELKVVSIMYYEELAEVTKHFKNFIIDLKHLNNRDFIRVIDFLTGLTNINGSMKRINKYTFEIKY